MAQPPADKFIADLLSDNATWAAGVTANDRDFFPESARGQSPQVRSLAFISALTVNDADACVLRSFYG